MDYYAKFNYFKECDVKEEGKRGEKMRTADRPAPAKREIVRIRFLKCKEDRTEGYSKRASIKKIQEEREMRNAVNGNWKRG